MHADVLRKIPLGAIPFDEHALALRIAPEGELRKGTRGIASDAFEKSLEVTEPALDGLGVVKIGVEVAIQNQVVGGLDDDIEENVVVHERFGIGIHLYLETLESHPRPDPFD